MTNRLSVVSKSEKQFLDDAVFAAERAKGKKLSGVLPVISFSVSVRLKRLKGRGHTNGMPQNSPGASLRPFGVNR